MKKLDYTARFPLSEHVFRPHYNGGEGFSSIAAAGYTPQMLRRAYSFDADFTGKGMNIAVISALDNVAIRENMNVFCQRFGLPIPEMSLYYPDGRAENTSRGWLVESSLDTQWAHVFAPDAGISVVFALNAEVESLLSAAEYARDALGADVICMCFGTEETLGDSELSEFMSGGDGIFVASSGDVGGDVSFPSSNPDCVSVGGTNLSLSLSSEVRVSETAWKNGGGGKSDVFEIAPYQGRFFNIYGMADGMRGTPDVSMMANYAPGVPIYVAQLGGWTNVGGTSLACAMFSGVCACIKEKYPEITKSTDMLSYLYSKAGTTGYEIPQYNFHDITLGKSGENFAEAGWDFATGLGSPIIHQLLL